MKIISILILLGINQIIVDTSNVNDTIKVEPKKENVDSVQIKIKELNTQMDEQRKELEMILEKKKQQ